MGLVRTEDVICPFCHRAGVVAIDQNAETRLIETTGLVFPRDEKRVLGKLTMTVTHAAARGAGLEDRWTCSGVPPAGWVMP